MNHFFLLNEALNVPDVPDLEKGISNLNDILLQKQKATDVFLKHNSIWEYNNGYVTNFYSRIVSKETQILMPIVFRSFKDHPKYIQDESNFDLEFPNTCNGFMGFNFISTSIPIERQIIDNQSFKTFKLNCANAIGYSSIDSFWDYRFTLFPNLIFCDNVKTQLEHLSVNDNRFKLMDKKLAILNAFVGNWVTGAFPFKNIGLDCSPDTPTRIKATEALRTFDCPPVGNRVFSLHIKWYFGPEPFRLYFFPEILKGAQDEIRRIYIGYIGSKAGIGF